MTNNDLKPLAFSNTKSQWFYLLAHYDTLATCHNVHACRHIAFVFIPNVREIKSTSASLQLQFRVTITL